MILMVMKAIVMPGNQGGGVPWLPGGFKALAYCVENFKSNLGCSNSGYTDEVIGL